MGMCYSLLIVAIRRLSGNWEGGTERLYTLRQQRAMHTPCIYILNKSSHMENCGYV
jgi:hypothetical protein